MKLLLLFNLTIVHHVGKKSGFIVLPIEEAFLVYFIFFCSFINVQLFIPEDLSLGSFMNLKEVVLIILPHCFGYYSSIV